MKSLQRFYITYSELDRLQSEGSIITNDIHSFARLRLDEHRDRLTFEFTWLSGCGFDRVEGVEQTVHLRWGKFRDFLDAAHQPDCPEKNKVFRAISLDARRGRPRLVFDGNRANLRAAIGDPRVRHKLGKALMANFNWPDADEIHLTNDFMPYSFFFREYRNGQAGMCGGLILHGQEDMDKAYYGIHT
ncbi:MAG: DUF4120 family protein [Clostridiales bacterium]|nr:DUF4120 family protein [Clostridiales bacterium]